MSAVSSLEMLRAVGALPIAGNAPAGGSATELPDYTAITDEIARINLSGRRAVNWQSVIAKSEVILRDHSKNLRVAVYLAYGLYEVNGLRGLAAGLGITGDLVETFWPDLHPLRARARIMALGWLVENVCTALEKDERRAPEEVAACEAALSAAERLQAGLTAQSSAAGEVMSALVPALQSRLEQIRRKSRQAAKPAASPNGPVASASVRPTPSPVTAIPGIPSDLTTSKARARALGELRSALLAFVGHLRAADMADPRVYILQRVSIWLPLCDLPPVINGRTELPRPPREVQGAIEAAVAAQEYATAVGLCEDAAANSLFWLDAHRIAAEALSALGHSAAAQAVRAETLALLHRLPALAALNFRDGTPFADPATRRWLGAEEYSERSSAARAQETVGVGAEAAASRL